MGDGIKKGGTPDVPPKFENNLSTSYETELLPLLCIPVGIDRSEVVPLFREVFERENSGHRTNGYARATIDAFGRMDVKLSFRLERRLVFARMNEIGRASCRERVSIDV